MKFLLFAVSAAFLGLHSVHCAESDEILVYRALLSRSESAAISHNGTYSDSKSTDVDSDSTKKYREQYRAWLHEQLKGVQDETIDDYLKNASNKPIIEKDTDLGVSFVLVEGSDMARIFSDNHIDKNWEKFRKQFHAKGLTTFSRVGFNSNKTQALVFMDFAWASLGAEGLIWLLEKTNGKWEIVSQAMESVS